MLSSTDGTQDLAMSFVSWLDVEVIQSGLPSVGRNAGQKRAGHAPRSVH